MLLDLKNALLPAPNPHLWVKPEQFLQQVVRLRCEPILVTDKELIFSAQELLYPLFHHVMPGWSLFCIFEWVLATQ